MKTFDLHPKAATFARKKSVAGGIITLSTLVVAVILLFFRARVDFGNRTEDVRMDDIAHDDALTVTLDLSFTGITSCNGQYQVEVLDTLGRAIRDPKSSLQIFFWAKECRVQGTIHVPAGKGTFRIYAASVSLENIHANHRIDGLTVGSLLLGVPYEARSLRTENTQTERAGAWSYYLSLVPTTSNGLNGYQIAATRTYVELSNPLTARGSLYFHYEASPVRMYMDSSLSFSKVFHFLARALGIVSGLFAFVGVAREVFLTTSIAPSTKKKKSELVM